MAMGYKSDAKGEYSTAIGYDATAQFYASLVIGRYNIPSPAVLSVGLPLTLFLSSATERMQVHHPMRLLCIKTVLLKLPEAHRAWAKF